MSGWDYFDIVWIGALFCGACYIIIKIIDEEKAIIYSVQDKLRKEMYALEELEEQLKNEVKDFYDLIRSQKL